ncbi:hypothetical protein GS483_24965 [Rhodococcus hoagii]|nr:hypothetical protein [Prescottella equi]
MANEPPHQAHARHPGGDRGTRGRSRPLERRDVPVNPRTTAADIEAIRALKARYFRLMDTKDWDGLAAVFTDDVTIDMTETGGGVTHSVDEYMPFLRAKSRRGQLAR